MGLAQQLHVASVRLEIPWFLVEPSRNGYDWTRADYIFSRAAAYGLQIQPILVYTPSWEGAYNSFPVAADFGAFVATFIGRYGGSINAVEMWNEPDQGAYIPADPVKYVNTILIPGYNAVKASHPAVQVIEGGSINDSGTCCPWLNGIYAAGGGNYFDIAAFHDYGGNYGTVVKAYQSLLSSHGQGGKPIWMGEYGVSDSTGSQQSSLITAALTATPGLAMAQYYTLRDEGVYTCCPVASTGESKQYGVVASNDVTKKSSFFVMQNLLGGSSPPPTQPPTPPPTPPPTRSPTPVATTAPPHPATPSSHPSAPGTARTTPTSSGGGQVGLGGTTNGPHQTPSAPGVIVGLAGAISPNNATGSRNLAILVVGLVIVGVLAASSIWLVLRVRSGRRARQAAAEAPTRGQGPGGPSG